MIWKKFFILTLRSYRMFISPLIEELGWARCRYPLTCSEYSIKAIKKHGAARGLILSAKRLLSCHP